MALRLSPWIAARPCQTCRGTACGRSHPAARHARRSSGSVLRREMSLTIMKFGGTSVQDADALSRVLRIVATRAAATPCIVVLSATAGTTDALLRIARERNVDAVARLRERHHDIVQTLVPTTEAHTAVDALCDELATFVRGMHLLGETTDRSVDEVASFGERLSTTIVAHACAVAGVHTAWLDVRRVMRTNARHLAAEVDMDSVRTLANDVLRPVLDAHRVVVTQGFIGSTAEGVTTTLGRGGSDYSAAILGAALHADVIEIWTDVSGVYSTDPRLAPTARPIPRMGFDEVRDLALYGAKVLHPDTIAPAVASGIPVHVRNTFAPEEHGTVITAEHPTDAPLHAATLVRRCTLASWRGNPAHHIRNAILHWSYHDGAACVVHTPTDDDVLDLQVALTDVNGTTSAVSIIAVCGPAAGSTQALSSITDAIRHHDVRAMVSGVTATTCFVVCMQDDAEATLRSIHDRIVGA
ncbi:MAG: aspartate kinase [Candidatus Kapabacteria bacterium]|nr:aspartate kinase [Candidatus Kapabacteria bacterium]